MSPENGDNNGQPPNPSTPPPVPPRAGDVAIDIPPPPPVAPPQPFLSPVQQRINHIRTIIRRLSEIHASPSDATDNAIIALIREIPEIDQENIHATVQLVRSQMEFDEDDEQLSSPPPPPPHDVLEDAARVPQADAQQPGEMDDDRLLEPNPAEQARIDFLTETATRIQEVFGANAYHMPQQIEEILRVMHETQQEVALPNIGEAVTFIQSLLTPLSDMNGSETESVGSHDDADDESASADSDDNIDVDEADDELPIEAYLRGRAHEGPQARAEAEFSGVQQAWEAQPDASHIEINDRPETEISRVLPFRADSDIDDGNTDTASEADTEPDPSAITPGLIAEFDYAIENLDFVPLVAYMKSNQCDPNVVNSDYGDGPCFIYRLLELGERANAVLLEFQADFDTRIVHPATEETAISVIINTHNHEMVPYFLQEYALKRHNNYGLDGVCHVLSPRNIPMLNDILTYLPRLPLFADEYGVYSVKEASRFISPVFGLCDHTDELAVSRFYTVVTEKRIPKLLAYRTEDGSDFALGCAESDNKVLTAHLVEKGYFDPQARTGNGSIPLAIARSKSYNPLEILLHPNLAKVIDIKEVDSLHYSLLSLLVQNEKVPLKDLVTLVLEKFYTVESKDRMVRNILSQIVFGLCGSSTDRVKAVLEDLSSEESCLAPYFSEEAKTKYYIDERCGKVSAYNIVQDKLSRTRLRRTDRTVFDELALKISGIDLTSLPPAQSALFSAHLSPFSKRPVFDPTETTIYNPKAITDFYRRVIQTMVKGCVSEYLDLPSLEARRAPPLILCELMSVLDALRAIEPRTRNAHGDSINKHHPNPIIQNFSRHQLIPLFSYTHFAKDTQCISTYIVFYSLYLELMQQTIELAQEIWTHLNEGEYGEVVGQTINDVKLMLVAFMDSMRKAAQAIGTTATLNPFDAVTFNGALLRVSVDLAYPEEEKESRAAAKDRACYSPIPLLPSETLSGSHLQALSEVIKERMEELEALQSQAELLNQKLQKHPGAKFTTSLLAPSESDKKKKAFALLYERAKDNMASPRDPSDDEEAGPKKKGGKSARPRMASKDEDGEYLEV